MPQAEQAGGCYNALLDDDRQISVEEKIAAAIWELQNSRDARELDEEEVAQLGRDILKLVLREFRPDFLEDVSPVTMSFGDLAREILDELAPEDRQKPVMYVEPYDEASIYSLTWLDVAAEDMTSTDDDEVCLKKGEPYLQ
jgi:hypothetical protein